MQALLTSIISKFNSTSGITTVFPGGLWLNEAADGAQGTAAAPKAYMLMFITSAPNQQWYASQVTNCDVTFIGFTEDSANTALTNMAAFTSVFDDVVLTLTGETNVWTNRGDDVLVYEVPQGDPSVRRSSATKRVYAVEAHYTFSYQ
jgi:hypothetical protein